MIKSCAGLRSAVGKKKAAMKAAFRVGQHTHTAGGCKTSHGGEKRGGSRGQIRIAPGSRVPL